MLKIVRTIYLPFLVLISQALWLVLLGVELIILSYTKEERHRESRIYIDRPTEGQIFLCQIYNYIHILEYHKSTNSSDRK